MKIKRAIISVSEKMGVVGFARELAEMGVEIISTGGTAKLLTGSGVPVRPIEDYTGFPEMMDGRLKTLHPRVHGGLLNIRESEEHAKAKAEHGIEDIDLVAVNLYPFEATVAKEGVTIEEAIEQIDIGGPTMLRSAAKNHRYVTVVVDHGDYSRVIEDMHRNGGGTSLEFRAELARKVFAHTARYDAAIASWLEEHARRERGEDGAPETVRLELVKAADLRYGENPHQRAACYVRRGAHEAGVASAKQLAGKELSFNNLQDASAALELAKDFAGAAAAVIKHMNPCGAAEADSLAGAYALAYEGDPKSAFGSVVAMNRRVDAATAGEMASPDRFVEVVVAPAFDEEAVRVLTEKPKWGKSVRLLAVGDFARRDATEFDFRTVTGGFLRQDRDLGFPELEALEVVTSRAPTGDEMRDLRFAWVVSKHLKSNALAIAKGRQLLGAGAGQMSRVDAADLAARKAGAKAVGAAAASDAFFPFPDGLEVLAQCGVRAVIQPGGAKNDQDVIDAANASDVAMVFTGVRHFRH